MRKRSVTRWLTACASMILSSQGQAQVDPGSIERTVPKIDVRPTKPGQQVLAPVTSPQSANVAGRFVLSAVIIDGATAFTSSELAQSFEPFLASEVGQAELEKISADITDRYRRAGYVLSFATIPEQSVRSGIVHIRVIEGYVSDVQVQGNSRATAAVHPVIERLKNERPLRAATLERMLGLARDLPGVVLGESRISRAADEPARHALLVTVGANRIRALGYADNRGTIDGARVRGYTALNVASLVKAGDELEVDLFAIPSHRFRYLYGQMKASVPIGTDGAALQPQRLPTAISYSGWAKARRRATRVRRRQKSPIHSRRAGLCPSQATPRSAHGAARINLPAPSSSEIDCRVVRAWLEVGKNRRKPGSMPGSDCPKASTWIMRPAWAIRWHPDPMPEVSSPSLMPSCRSAARYLSEWGHGSTRSRNFPANTACPQRVLAGRPAHRPRLRFQRSDRRSWFRIGGGTRLPFA